MRLNRPRVVRPVDTTDLSDLTSAKRTGPAHWTDDGALEIPFDRELTSDETAAVALRLASADDNEADFRKRASDFLDDDSPSLSDLTAQVQTLTDLVLRLLDKPTT